jgi:hypothetical protein
MAAEMNEWGEVITPIRELITSLPAEEVDTPDVDEPVVDEDPDPEE